jgi:hypothetical protein
MRRFSIIACSTFSPALNELNYLKANMEVQIQSYDGEVIGLELPKTVELQVTETEPGIKLSNLIHLLSSRLVILFGQMFHYP